MDETKQQVLERLAHVRNQLDQTAAQQEAIVRDARALGLGWREIGLALGVTQQAAQQRWAKRLAAQ